MNVILREFLMSMRKSGLAVLLLGSLVMAPALSSAQASYPNLQGSGERPGANSDPFHYNSGNTLLQWFYPYGSGATTTSILDNYPWTGTPAGALTLQGTWTLPAGPADEAGDPYVLAESPYSTPANPFQLGVYNSYYYSNCTPALSAAAPTTAEFPAQLSRFKWSFTEPMLGATAGNYALYAWLPVGPTIINGVTTYPQEFFVYYITYGNGQTYTDIVDTYQSGGGFVRLGNGGLPTNVTFPYNGTNPLTITLYNTIPYNSSGNLSTGTIQTAGDYLVYANACEAVPISGIYTASPTSDYLNTAAGIPTVDPKGDPDVGSDYLGKTYFARITAAENVFNSGLSNGSTNITEAGVVRNFQMNPNEWAVPPVDGVPITYGIPTVLWQYSPVVTSPYLGTTVTPGSNATAGWTSDTANPHYQGASYDSTAVSPATVTQTVTYLPTLTTGNYTIYSYFPGNGGGETYGTAVYYTIYQGATAVYTGTVDESGASQAGWIQLGVGAYNSNATSSGNGPLSVKLTNGTAAGSTGTLAYANAVRFVGAANLAINSTPVHAEVNLTKQGGGGTALTQVVIVADESGRIHCLDEAGNGDGTTNEYWSYPSTPNPAETNWQDPNLLDGSDGPANSTVPTAIMPIAFDLSTAVVETINNNSYLYIASTNGRVYCISMAGRGDYVAEKTGVTPVVGSTKRVWEYPNDYPEATVQSNLGPIQGSLAYAGTADGVTNPTIYVPAYNGRIIALDAVGNSSTKQTTVDWAYPALNAVNLPPIVMTPMVAFGNIYFGTEMNQSTQTSGTFYALNLSTGAVQWSFAGTTLAPAEDFICGPTSASKAVLSQEPAAAYSVTPQDSVYVLSDNEYVYGLNAETGAVMTTNPTNSALVGTLPYVTDELFAASNTNLSFSFITTVDRTGTSRPMPVVLVPTNEGHVYALAANVDDYNIFTTENFTSGVGSGQAYLTLYQINTTGANVTSVANSNQRLIFGDDAGFLYVYDNNNLGYLETAGQPPSSTSESPNQPGPADAFRYPQVSFLTQPGYTLLRSYSAGTNETSITEAQALSPALQKPAPPKQGSTTQPYAFEWGETAYILVTGFPYATQIPPGTAIQEPQVNIKISVNGKVVRDFQVDSHLFASPATASQLYNPNNVTWPSWDPLGGNAGTQDAYGVVAFTFQGGGANALPPGNGTISADITTAAVGGTQNPQPQEIMADPAYASKGFIMDNPLGVQVVDNYTGVVKGGGGTRYHSFGASSYPYDADAEAQGTPTLISTPTNPIYVDEGQQFSGALDQYNDPLTGIDFDTSGNETELAQLTAAIPFGIDGTTTSTTMYLIDRSLMALIRPPGVGLGGVRVDHGDLAWQGGSNTIYRPLFTLYPNFEDTPINFPNTSLDYPNINRDELTFSLNPNGAPQNPALTAVTLNPPLPAQGQTTLVDDATIYQRVLQPTPLQVSINVPMYQPYADLTKLQTNALGNDPLNLLQWKQDSAGTNVIPQGYYGDLNIYVDSTGSGTFTDQDPYRHINLAANVSPSFRLSVSTPSLDLGSLPNGANYSPLSPLAQDPVAGPASPWNGNASYQPFTVVNNSNTNILDIRVAKATTINGIAPWAFLSSDNDPNAWLDGTFDLLANIDLKFGVPSAVGDEAFFQKPRVIDNVGSQLIVNPTPRANANIPGSLAGAPVNSRYPSTQPKIGVSLPFGFPSGAYTSLVRLIDDTPYIFASPTGTASGPYNDLEQVWEPVAANNGVPTALEPATDPGLNLSFRAREVRVTNTSTPYAAPMVDNLLSPNSVYAYTNNSPAAMRDAFGSVVLAWTSNRPTYTPTVALTEPPSMDSTKIYMASVPNSSTFSGNAITVPGTDPVLGEAPSSPLRDLNFFEPYNTGSWFTPETPNGFPAASLFSTDQYGAVTTGTERYGSPAFPQDGEFDLFDSLAGSGPSAMFTDTYMAFVGAAQKSNTAGRVEDERVFVTQVTTSSGGGVKTTAPSQNTNEDPLTAKGKPAVVQTTTGAFVFYGVTAAGQSTIHSDRVAGTAFAPDVVPLNFGTGFESVTSPSAAIRTYGSAGLIQLTFAGKLRGQSHSDIYMSQLMIGRVGGSYHLVDSNGIDAETAAAGSPFMFFQQQSNEPLVVLGSGQYRARGVYWNRQATIQLLQWTNGVPANLLIAGSQNFDRETGLISYDTTLGGKVYFNPDLGTVHFTQGMPSTPPTLTYTPAFLRVSAMGTSSSAYTEPTGLFDDHFVSNYNEWYLPSGANAGPGNQIRDARMMFFYGKAAAGGIAAQPYRATMRFGLALPNRIATNAGGVPVAVTVSGNNGPYQLDPANGRVYFTSIDENSTVTVTYTGIDAQGTQVAETASGLVTWVPEQLEQPVLIDTPTDETNLSAFLDPFTYPTTSSLDNERPALVWMFYTSTRAGQQDVYMQTIAPNLTPVTP